MLRILAFLLVLAVSAPTAAEAPGKRVALVLANGSYQHAAALPNATRDGEAVAAALRKIGFEVYEGVDLPLAKLRELVRDFAYAMTDAELGLFYYAGHGLQVAGENYIVPVDAALEHEIDLSFEALPMSQVTGLLERKERTAIVILDACRDNPFTPRLARSMGGTRSLSNGLAEISPGLGMLVVFATDPGRVAFDGQGDHSPFTAALLEHVATPGLEIRQLMTRVRRDVLTATDGAQRPWDNSSLLSDVYLVPKPADQPAEPVVAALGDSPAGDPGSARGSGPTDQQRFWDGVQEIADPALKKEALEAYLAEFPEGRFATLARLQMAALSKEAPSTGAADASVGTGTPPAEAVANPSAAAAEASEAERNLRPSEATSPEPFDGDSQVAALSEEEAAAPAAPAAPAVTPEAVEAELGLGRERRRQIQVTLRRLGYETGGADGIFGPRSRAALAQFQQAGGLAATGYLDATTLTRLEQAAAVLAARPPAASAPAAEPAREPPASTVRPAASAPPPGSIVACRIAGGPAFAAERLITIEQCKRLGGAW